ncbi:ABC transporter substrate-binding protein [Paenibacillus crassostreae]|uniref:ABC transporter substrate-binding protein n=2 Tax=Paenibacillus crassostreae TaxID=1763538 RepID=A0A167EFZ8_9BACL|nr:ABC transporter substrate-binding protein [Paenibacillus crassostreae]OAB75512.1 ABC transporter substrate-binding protein [Paenibacillus crassostreae]
MMNVFKKITGLTLIAGMTLLTACGGNTGTANVTATNGANGTTEIPATETVATASEPVTIEFWYGLGGKLGENMEALIQKFNDSQEEVIVKGIVQADYTETQQKLQAAIASSDVPAAVLSSNVDWARKGYFSPIDELIALQPDFNQEDFIQTFLNQGKVDGKQYFLPMYGTTQVMYYRKDMFEKNGILAENIKTWEDLAAAAAKMTVKEGNNTTVFGWEPMWGAGNMIDATLSKGGSILSADGTEVMIDSTEWVETWDQFRKWIHEDKTMRIHSGGQGWEYWYKTIDDVMKGQAAGYTGSSGDQGDLDFSIVSAMEQPGWAGVGGGKPVAEAILAGIPAKASDIEKQAAMKWLTYFTNSENTAFWSINTGYISVRQSASEDPAFVAYSESNPQITIPLKQASHGSEPFQDPTGGKITDALKIAADKVQIGNTPAAEALKEAKDTAQAALDKLK